MPAGERECDRCGRSYPLVVKATVVWSPERTARVIRERVEGKSIISRLDPMAWAFRRQVRTTIGVLCPHCGRFSSAAMKRHFRSGFRSGLVRMTLPTTLLLTTVFAFFASYMLACLGLAVGYSLVDKEPDAPVLLVVGAAGWVLGAVAWVGFWGAGARALLQSFTDDQVEDFVKQEYRHAGDRLKFSYTLFGLTLRLCRFQRSLRAETNRLASSSGRETVYVCTKCSQRLIVPESGIPSLRACTNCGSQLKPEESLPESAVTGSESTTVRFRCECGNVVTAPSEHAGKRGKCPRCGTVNKIPRPDSRRGDM